MRKPVVPSSRQTDGVRLVSFLQGVLDWIDAGTRTQDLQSDTIADEDLIELVKPTGERYTVTAATLKAYTTAP